MLSNKIIKHVFELLDLDMEEKRRRFTEIADLSKDKSCGPMLQLRASTITTNTEEESKDA
ncbi:unnamed protein product [marine sediment metagenome]|uniref:Uncharacterized protein n=1 Tax=marine sediment metagenome TaxID=412755 RepID=X1AGL6_9ZZZZ